MSKDKNDKLIDKYSGYDANLKTYIAPDWTLEYSLALSVLAPLLLESIHEVRYKNPYTKKRKEAYEDLKSRLEDDSMQNEETAYIIFKPLNNKNVSKAEVAQLLAIKINEILKDPKEVEKWKNKVLDDMKLKYLVDAIMHSANIITDMRGN